MSEERTATCRLKDYEQEYINNFWDDKFSDYVHSSIKRDISQIKKNKIKNIFEKSISSMMLLAIGSIFVLFSMQTLDFFSKVLMLLVGVFFSMYGLTSIFIEVFEQCKKNF